MHKLNSVGLINREYKVGAGRKKRDGGGLGGRGTGRNVIYIHCVSV